MAVMIIHYIFLFVSHYGHLSSRDLAVDVTSNVKNIFKRDYGNHPNTDTNQSASKLVDALFIRQTATGTPKAKLTLMSEVEPINHKNDMKKPEENVVAAQHSESSLLDLTKKKKDSSGHTQPINDTTPALILYWNHVSSFLGPHMMVHPPCHVQCHYSEDRADLHKAEGVFFHFISPPFDVPGYKSARQKWIAFCMESEINYPILQDRDLLGIFDVQMTYHLRSHIVTYYMNWEVDLFKPFPSFSERTAKNSVVTVISNCHASNNRMQFVDELSKYIGIDKYGSCFGKRFRDFNEIMKTHKFFLSFENSNIEDYVTEKVFRAWEYGIVPVYMGAPNIDDFAPSNRSVIRTSDYKSPKELAQHLLNLIANPQQYEEYLRWKTDPSVHTEKFKRLYKLTRVDTRCLLCDKIIKERHIKSKTFEPEIPRERAGAPHTKNFPYSERGVISEIKKRQAAQAQDDETA